MRKNIVLVVASLLTVVPAAVAAQEDEPTTAYIYATYFICAPDGESRADEIIATSYKPH